MYRQTKLILLAALTASLLLGCTEKRDDQNIESSQDASAVSTTESRVETRETEVPSETIIPEETLDTPNEASEQKETKPASTTDPTEISVTQPNDQPSTEETTSPPEKGYDDSSKLPDIEL